MSGATIALAAGGAGLAVVWLSTRIPTPEDLGAAYGWRYGFFGDDGKVSSIGGTHTAGGFAPSAPFVPPGPRPVVKLLGTPGEKGYFLVSGNREFPIGQPGVSGSAPELYTLPNPNYTAYEESLQWHEGFAAGEAKGRREGSGTGNIIALVTAAIQFATKIASIVAAAI